MLVKSAHERWLAYHSSVFDINFDMWNDFTKDFPLTSYMLIVLIIGNLAEDFIDSNVPHPLNLHNEFYLFIC